MEESLGKNTFLYLYTLLAFKAVFYLQNKGKIDQFTAGPDDRNIIKYLKCSLKLFFPECSLNPIFNIPSMVYQLHCNMLLLQHWYFGYMDGLQCVCVCVCEMPITIYFFHHMLYYNLNNISF